MCGGGGGGGVGMGGCERRRGRMQNYGKIVHMKMGGGG